MRLIGLAALGLILALSLLAADAQQAGKAILPSSWFNAKPDVILALGGDVAPNPAISRVGVIWNPDHADDELQETQKAARTLGIQIQSLEVRGAADFEGAFPGGDRGAC
jgi:hypothetical protein